MITLDEYQEAAHATSLVVAGVDDFLALDLETEIRGIHTYLQLSYATLKLNGEAGEVAELIGKALRDGDTEISMERSARLEKEVGDVLWYVGEICTIMGWSLSEVATKNISKLADRQARNQLKGDGDNR